MQPIASGSSAASRIPTDERQSLDDLKTPHKSAVVPYNIQITEIPESELIKSLEQLGLDSPPEPMVSTIDARQITGLNIPGMPQSSDIGLADASQPNVRTPYGSSSEPESADVAMVPDDAVSANSGNTLTSLDRPTTDDSEADSSTDDSDNDSSAYDSSAYDSDSIASTDESDTESACRKALTAEVCGAAATENAPVPVSESQVVALMNSQSSEIDARTADIFHCNGNYLELRKVINFGRFIRDAKFSPTSKHLVIHGDDRNDHRVLGIWRQTADGNWSQNGKIRQDTVRYQFNRSEDTFLSTSHNGDVTVSKLNRDGFWEEAVVLAHRPSTKGEDIVSVNASFSPRQDKIMTHDFWASKVKVLREDSNGRWTPLTQEIRHRRCWGPQQPPFRATDHYLLTYRGLTATIWEFNDDSNCLEEKKVIECSKAIWSAQMCDDERYAVLFTTEQTIFLGCDVDGGWSQIGEACHPEHYSKNDDKYIRGFVGTASFNASRQYALSHDSNYTAIISGYDDHGSWVVKTEIQDCLKVEFSPSGRKLLATILKPEGCNNTDDPLAKDQTLEHSGYHQGFIKRHYANFKLWDCSSTGDRLDNFQTLEHTGSKHAIFSPSENFLLTYGVESNSVCIWGYVDTGNLVEKARVSHRAGINNAAFNAQEDSVLTRSGFVVKIQSLDSQGEWLKQLEVKHQGYVDKARFSPSGHLAYTIGMDGRAGILGRDNNGQWVKLAMTNRVDGYSIEDAYFNGLENHFLTYGNKIDRKDKHQPGLVQLWGLDDDGKWVKKEQIRLDYSVKSAKFSPDDGHLLIQCKDDRHRGGSSKNGTVLLWKMPVGPEQELLPN